MDPDTTLSIIRELVQSLDPKYLDYSDGEDVAQLIKAIDSLDEWIIKGGFLPQAWERPDDRSQVPE